MEKEKRGRERNKFVKKVTEREETKRK